MNNTTPRQDESGHDAAPRQILSFSADPRPPANQQPMPINSQVMHLDRRGYMVDVSADPTRIPEVYQTIVALTWRSQDATRCVRCAECDASRSDLGITSLCLKKVRGYVPKDRADSFHDLAGLHQVARADERAVAGS